jgi:hypothetical protein
MKQLKLGNLETTVSPVGAAESPLIIVLVVRGVMILLA